MAYWPGILYDAYRPNAYRVESSRIPGRWYMVQLAPGAAACNCPGGRPWGRLCQHMRRVIEMTNALAKLPEADQAALAPLEIQPPKSVADKYPPPVVLQTMYHLARSAPYAKGQAVPKSIDHPGKALMVMVAGYELGMGPAAALRHVVAVNGRTEPDAQAMMGIILANDPSAHFDFEEISADRCKLHFARGGRHVISCEYTTADAERAGQLPATQRVIARWENSRPVYAKDAQGNDVWEINASSPWNTHRHLMLAYNAIRTAAKLGAPDLINAIVPFMGSVAEFVEGSSFEDASEAFEAVGSLLEPDPEFNFAEPDRERAPNRASSRRQQGPMGPPEMSPQRQGVFDAIMQAVRDARCTSDQLVRLIGAAKASAAESYMAEHKLTIDELIARAAAVDVETGEMRDED